MSRGQSERRTGNNERSGNPRSFVAVAVLLVAAFLLSSCSMFQVINPSSIESRLQEIQDASAKPLDRYALTQGLISCVSDTKQIETVYNSIPSSQRKDISLPSFDAYIRALSRLTTGMGQISSYRFADKTEKSDIVEGFSDAASEHTDVLRDTIPVELLFGNENAVRQPVYFYIQENEQGTPYLSSWWIDECLQIYNLAVLYFSAMEEQDRNVISTLIRSGYTGTDTSIADKVLNNKADKLISYYHVKVKTPFKDYRLESLDIAEAAFLQKEVLDNDSQAYHSQSVRFFRNASMSIEIKDNIENKLDTGHFYLYVDGKRSIRIGDRADAKQFKDLFGAPIYVGSGISGSPSDTKKSDTLFLVSYNGMSVTLRGNLYGDGSWDGQIIRIRLRGTQGIYSIGTDIRTEITRDDLLMLFPFVDEADFSLKTEIDESEYRMSFVFGSNREKLITGVVLEMVS